MLGKAETHENKEEGREVSFNSSATELCCAGHEQGPVNVPSSPGLITASSPLANQVEELLCLGNSASKLGNIYSLEFEPEPYSSLKTNFH